MKTLHNIFMLSADKDTKKYIAPVFSIHFLLP